MLAQQVEKYEGNKTSPFFLRIIRSQPHLYSLFSKTLLFYSRHIAAFSARQEFNKMACQEFRMSGKEEKHCRELQEQGFTVINEFFPGEFVDRIFSKADTHFSKLDIDMHDAYSVQSGLRDSLRGLSYEELARTEKFIALKDPLINIPEVVSIAFHPSLWKIACNFLEYIPPWFKPMVVRDFPSRFPRESSNFHKDNDEADSIQIFVYLVDIDDSCAPLIYIPGTNRCDVKSCRPRLNRDLGQRANDGRISDAEIERFYPREKWVPIKAKKGSVAIIHGNGLHKGPAWDFSEGESSSKKRPRTAIRLDIDGYKISRHPKGVQRKKILRQDYESLSPWQKIFAREFLIV